MLDMCSSRFFFHFLLHSRYIPYIINTLFRLFSMAMPTTAVRQLFRLVKEERKNAKRIWKSDWKESPATDTHEWSTFKDFRRTLWIWIGKCKNCMQGNSERAESEKRKKRKIIYKEHLHKTAMIYSILLNDKWFCWMYFTMFFFSFLKHCFS